MRITGLRQASRQLKRLGRGLQQLEGQHQVPVNDLLTPAFMRRYTDFQSFDEMVDASGFAVETTEDFEKIPDAERDAFVAKRTRFNNWDEMLGRGSEDWVTSRLGL